MSGIYPLEKTDQFLPSRITAHPIYDAVLDSSLLLQNYDTLSFSFGNPIIQMMKGSMKLLKSDATSSPEVPKTPAICVRGVPNSFRYDEFRLYCESYISEIKEIRFVRCDEEKKNYSILISFKDIKSADKFHQYVNEPTSSFSKPWRAHFILDMWYESETQNPEDNNAEQRCPLCDDILEQDRDVIVTSICNHSFHVNCIGTSCFVCLSSPKHSANLIDCSMKDKVLICLHCQFACCKRPNQPDDAFHSGEGYEATHRYFIEPETQHVWDAVDKNYVHTIIQPNTDGDIDHIVSTYVELLLSQFERKRAIESEYKKKHEDIDEYEVKLKERIEWGVSDAVRISQKQDETLKKLEEEIRVLEEKYNEEEEMLKNLKEGIHNCEQSCMRAYISEQLCEEIRVSDEKDNEEEEGIQNSKESCMRAST